MEDLQEQKFHHLTEDSVSGLICRLALPCIISMLVTAFYNMADTFFVGMLKSNPATGAVGVVFSLMAIIQAIGFFFGHGSGNFISRELGKHHTEEASNMAATGFFSALATGLLICVLGQIFLTPLANLLGSTPTILPYARDYMRVILLGAPWMTASLVLNNQLRFQGSAMYGMVGIVSGAVLNIGLKYCRMLEGKFKLYDNLKDIFDPKNKNQEYENIFEIQFKHSGSWGLEGSIQHSYWGPRNVGGPTNFGGWGGFGPTQYLYDSYDNNDKRKKAFFITEYAGVTQTPPSSGKFWDAETGNVIEDDNLNFTMIRYADVLLMKAEALNSIDDTSNDKYDALNEVRGRAGLTSITAADNLNKEQFAEVVLEERLHELCCEHLRRWDLIRFGKLGEYMKDHAGVTIQPYHVLYPIPQAAVDANDAITENNEGY